MLPLRYALLPVPRNPKPAFLWENGSLRYHSSALYIKPKEPPCLTYVGTRPTVPPAERKTGQSGWLFLIVEAVASSPQAAVWVDPRIRVTR